MFGTNFTYDALTRTTSTDPILKLGENRVFDAIEEGLAIHNRLTQQVFGLFAEVMNETFPGQYRHDVYGTNRILRMQKIDQVGVVDVQKVTAGQTVGFPIDRKQGSVGWTKDYLEVATAQELVKDFNAIRQGDILEMRDELLSSIFNPANRTSIERFSNHISINVRALINADGSEMPPGPNGEVFNGATHTHYMAATPITNAALLAAVNTVKEHYSSGQVYIYINKGQEATIRGFADFYAYPIESIIPSQTAARARGGPEQNLPLDEKEIGVFHNCIVAVRPWMPNNYYFVHIIGATINPIVRFRQRRGGLYLAAQMDSYPLRADFMERESGAGVFERTAGAILYNGASYVAPTWTYA